MLFTRTYWIDDLRRWTSQILSIFKGLAPYLFPKDWIALNLILLKKYVCFTIVFLPIRESRRSASLWIFSILNIILHIGLCINLKILSGIIHIVFLNRWMNHCKFMTWRANIHLLVGWWNHFLENSLPIFDTYIMIAW